MNRVLPFSDSLRSGQLRRLYGSTGFSLIAYACLLSLTV